MKYTKLLLKLSIILVLTTVATPALVTAPTVAYGPLIHIIPDHGPVGTEVSVYGNLFTPSRLTDDFTSGITVFAKTYFPNKTAPVRTTAIDIRGVFETYFVVGQYPAGIHWVWVYDEFASPPIWVSTKFTVEPQIKLSQSSGYVGDNITAIGTGFAATSNITIYFDEVEVATTISDQNGSFSSTTIIVPASDSSSHKVKAVDASINQGTSEFVTKQQVAISPTSGRIGEVVTIYGTGFAARKNIIVAFEDNIVVTSPESVKTSYSGNFTARLFIPTSGVNSYTIEVSDGSNKANTTFDVVLGGKLNRIAGYIGSEVTLSGAGFIPGKIAIIYFDSMRLADTSVDVNGIFSSTFKIPASPGGEHIVSATDGTNTIESTFTVVLVAVGKLNRVIGYVGSDVTFSGTGFVPDRIITIYYDAIPIAEAAIDANGNFSVDFKIPISPGREHIVSATDGINTTEYTLTLESTAPPTPLPLLPTDAITVKPETHFIWESVTDPSGITYTLQVASDVSFTSDNSSSLLLEKSNLTATQYILTSEEQLEPTKEEVPYYWRVRAIDNAFNIGRWSPVQKFYLVFSRSPMSPWVLYSVLAEGGVFILLFGYWMVRKIGKSKETGISATGPNRSEDGK